MEAMMSLAAVALYWSLTIVSKLKIDINLLHVFDYVRSVCLVSGGLAVAYDWQ